MKVILISLVIGSIILLMGAGIGYYYGIEDNKERESIMIKKALELEDKGIKCVNGKIVPEKDYEDSKDYSGYSCVDGFWIMAILTE